MVSESAGHVLSKTCCHDAKGCKYTARKKNMHADVAEASIVLPVLDSASQGVPLSVLEHILRSGAE